VAESRAERIHALLGKLRSFNLDIEGAAVATGEGLVISSSLSEGLDEESLSAVCAAIATVSKHTAEELNKGEPTEMIIKAPEGYIFIIRAGVTSLLVVITQSSANMGLILMNMRKVSMEIGPIVDQ